MKKKLKKINSENFLIAHCLAKTYAKLKNVESAIIYTKKAISLNRFHTESFLLLSLLFSAKNDLKMSNSIIEELITENPFNPTLYIIKFFLKSILFFLIFINC